MICHGIKMARNGRMMSKADCAKAMQPLEGDIKQIREALVGVDLRGGLVKDVQQLNSKLDDIIDDAKSAKQLAAEVRDSTRQWRLIIFGSLLAAMLALSVEVIKGLF
jgi:hypothetical protein